MLFSRLGRIWGLFRPKCHFDDALYPLIGTRERRKGGLLVTATISLSIHALALGIVLAVMTHPLTGRIASVNLPVIRVSLVSMADVHPRATETAAPPAREEKTTTDAVRAKPVATRSGQTPVPPEPDRRHTVDAIGAANKRPLIDDAGEGVTFIPAATAAVKSSGQADTRHGDGAARPGGRSGVLPSEPAAPSPVLPRYRITSRPAYPAQARERGYEGVVLVSAAVGTDGRVGDVRIKKSSGYALLDQSAMNAVRTWIFEPARRMNTPIASQVDIPIRFSLHDPD